MSDDSMISIQRYTRISFWLQVVAVVLSIGLLTAVVVTYSKQSANAAQGAEAQSRENEKLIAELTTLTEQLKTDADLQDGEIAVLDEKLDAIIELLEAHTKKKAPGSSKKTAVKPATAKASPKPSPTPMVPPGPSPQPSPSPTCATEIFMTCFDRMPGG